MGKCPHCGGNVTENKRAFVAVTRLAVLQYGKKTAFFTAKKKTVTRAIVTVLFKNGKVKLSGCYSEKTFKTYNYEATLDDTGGKFVNFTMEFGTKKK